MIEQYDLNELRKCKPHPVSSSLCNPSSLWPRIFLAYFTDNPEIYSQTPHHLGIAVLNDFCHACKKITSLHAVHVYIITHPWLDIERTFLSILECAECNCFSVAKCSDWDSDPNYVFRYDGQFAFHLSVHDLPTLCKAINELALQLDVPERKRALRTEPGTH